MNFLFLHPFPLTTDSHFEQFDPVKEDTLKLQFDADSAPIFGYANGDSYNPGYTFESVFFPSYDSVRINAWIIRPDSNFNGKTLFFVHGNAGNLVFQYQLATPFVERGYKVFLFDYSEFGFSKGKAKRKYVLKDALSAFDYLLALDEFQNDQIIVYGQSLGGHLAAVVGTMKQDRVDAMVLEGAFSSHKDVAADRASFLGRIFVKEIYSGMDSIPQFKKPLLVVHSVNDRVVPYKLGKKLYEHANAPKEFYSIDSCHICGPLYYLDSIELRIQRML